MHAVLVGCLLTWIPSLAVLAWLVWRAPIIDDFDVARDRRHLRH